MMYKSLIGALALCAVTACMDSAEPIAESNDSPTSGGLAPSYYCSDVVESDSLNSVRATFEIAARVKRKTSKTQQSFKMGGDYLKRYTLYEADIKYRTFKPNPENPDSSKKQNIFEYKNVKFEYENQNIILKTPQDNNLPACKIRFEKRSKNSEHKIGVHKCEFNKNDMGYRAATFEFKCIRAGKIAPFTEPEL